MEIVYKPMVTLKLLSTLNLFVYMSSLWIKTMSQNRDNIYHIISWLSWNQLIFYLFVIYKNKNVELTHA